ncbi:hypothetical protein [Rhodoferax sp.]|uniref:hypothetical protein n=1 Tax=Rhodoferax sp. TaxID=50421 RepID=UPI002732192C|nr:hypothetical protein [Rhodoferax sp.]MDP2440735.1 hypothetical protein [Rhodoferax sp.]MDP3189826.1 hypothetical protein [Rhodoferax sp.]MDP3336984.1 hypothetical protein [Rhodoferax sp.]MDZ4209321.1 hypothetical protein [Rhodoferax sp.]
MTVFLLPFRSLTAIAAVSLLCSAAALAAPPTAATEAQARYRQDMTACNSGQSHQDLATCRREAGNALAEARRGHLNDAPGQYQQNALRRCQVHEGEDRLACEARMGASGSTEGSAATGGILREAVTVTPVK